ncbi:MAG TPA: glycosyltransferase [Paraburkholderia sp.]|uniref:glycosyltransferase family 2 protein n=1 Tax=Paraburkholderia sp. TaxID=1926495 RepID=UPI002B45EBBE|nr:glycosyltransferase [Paraburkholderia sp.]HKR39319.1 glycosyltransferase [Paraburkholderia sp.]
MPQFSVIIPTYNCAAFIKQALDSVLAQTCDDYEVIVVNDGSTDDTKEVLRPYLTRNNVRYIEQENQGLAAARNTAIRAACGAYIALLDADDIWLPEKLVKQAEYLHRHPRTALLCSNAFAFHDEDISNKGVLVRSLPDDGVSSDALLRRLLTQDNPIVCPTTVIAKWALDQVGVYDEVLTRQGAEDRDLSLRIASRYSVSFMPDCLAYYRIRSNSMQRNVEKMLRARLYVLQKFIQSNPAFLERCPVQREAFAGIYLWAASGHVSARQFGKAIGKLSSAARHHPKNTLRQLPQLVKLALGVLRRALMTNGAVARAAA